MCHGWEKRSENIKTSTPANKTLASRDHDFFSFTTVLDFVDFRTAKNALKTQKLVGGPVDFSIFEYFVI